VVEKTQILSEKMVGIYNSTIEKLLIKDPIEKKYPVKFIGEIAPLQRGFDLPNDQIEKGDYPIGYSNGISKFHNKFMATGPGVFTGRSGTIGNIFYTEENYWPHNTTLWVTNFNNNLPKFIYYLYTVLNLKKYSAGTGVPTLNRNDIHKIEIRIPPQNIQNEIVNKLDRLRNKMAEVDSLIEKIKQIQKQLINQIFG